MKNAPTNPSFKLLHYYEPKNSRRHRRQKSMTATFENFVRGHPVVLSIILK